MSRLRRAMMFLLTKSTLLGGIYLGHSLHYDINKLWLNTFEKRTPVKEGHYQNIGELKIFYKKVNGELIPQYGIDDNKINIGQDLYPNNTINLNQNSIYEITNILEEKISNSTLNETEKRTLENKLEQIKEKIDSPINDSLTNILNTLTLYQQSNGPKKELTKQYLQDLIYNKIDNH